MKIKIMVERTIELSKKEIAVLCKKHNKVWGQPENTPVVAEDVVARAINEGVVDDPKDKWIVSPEDEDLTFPEDNQ